MKPWLRRCRFVLFLLLLGLFAAFPAQASEAPFDPAAYPAEDPRFYGLAWEELIAGFLREHGLDGSRVGLYYYNTVTGEAQGWNGDAYFTAASTYKVPINLVFADKVSRGEMTLDDPVGGVPLRNIQFNTLRNSDNSQGELLIEALGNYTQYKAAMTPYLCPPGEELDPVHNLENAFTPRQLAYALRLLYEAPERFPEVLDHMLLAQPDSYFRQKERRFPIAHKYGYYADLGFRACNDIGIVWTHEPILLVMLTDAVNGGVEALADYCVLMCDYSEYWHARHLEEAEQLELERRVRGEAEETARQEAEARFRAEALAARQAAA
ncbi:MAG: class A beta-lactamase-related serine hydrolase, partial [Oscillospiraceae bacterium]|nr:class A beta-lactamase-related serine hydrolase [Oscillospiraceae bacterium]